jgi:hypothetical protein
MDGCAALEAAALLRTPTTIKNQHSVTPGNHYWRHPCVCVLMNIFEQIGHWQLPCMALFVTCSVVEHLSGCNSPPPPPPLLEIEP